MKRRTSRLWKKGETAKIIVVSDMHAPYHDERSVDLCLETVQKVKPTHVVFIGDGVDAYPVSSYPKHPRRKLAIEDEIGIANGVLESFEQAMPTKCSGIYVEGNHENRLKRYLVNTAPELFGICPSMYDLLKIDDRGWRWVDYGDAIKLGDVTFTHDVGRCGKSAVMQSLADWGASLVIGHTHRLGVSWAGTTSGSERHFCMSVGWLGSYDKIDYRSKALSKREWQHGFGMVDIAPDGTGFPTPLPIVNGMVNVGGTIIKA